MLRQVKNFWERKKNKTKKAFSTFSREKIRIHQNFDNLLLSGLSLFAALAHNKFSQPFFQQKNNLRSSQVVR